MTSVMALQLLLSFMYYRAINQHVLNSFGFARILRAEFAELSPETALLNQENAECIWYQGIYVNVREAIIGCFPLRNAH